MSDYQSNYNASNATFDFIDGIIQTPDQPYIQTLAGLLSIQNVNIPPTNWNYVASMQNVSTSASPLFASLTSNGTLTIGTNNITTTIASHLATINQDLGTTSNPSFSSVTATTFTGNLIGNATTATTVTAGSQPNITSLPNLSSIDGTTILSSVWSFVDMDQHLKTTSNPTFATLTSTGTLTIGASAINTTIAAYLATINQNLSTTSNPTFATLTSTGTVTIGGNNINAATAAYLSVINQNLNSTSSPIFSSLTSTGTLTIGVNNITTTIAGHLATVNQDLGTSNSPSFNTVTATTFTGNLIGNATTATTVTAATQSNIIALPSLSSIDGQTISSSKWPFVATLDQNVGTNDSVTHLDVTATRKVVSPEYDSNVSGAFKFAGSGNINFDPNIGSQTFIFNYNATKPSGANNVFQLYNNVTDRTLLLNCTTAGTVSGSNALEINAPLTIGSTSDLANSNGVQLYINGDTKMNGNCTIVNTATFSSDPAGNIVSNRYTPTVTNNSNTQSLAGASVCKYTRVGKIVTLALNVNGQASGSVPVGTQMAFDVTYPINSTVTEGLFTATGNCFGNGTIVGFGVNNGSLNTFRVFIQASVALAAGNAFACYITGQYSLS